MASIKSKDCSASSIKSLLKVAFAQLSNSAADSADSGGEDEDENEEKGEDSAIGRKVSPRALRTWYHNQVPEATTEKPPPLVFILEDFEGFPPLVLQDLIHNLRLLALRVVLVFDGARPGEIPAAPPVGGVVAASVNASFQTDVSRAARYAYRQRWLMARQLLPGPVAGEAPAPAEAPET